MQRSPRSKFKIQDDRSCLIAARMTKSKTFFGIRDQVLLTIINRTHTAPKIFFVFRIPYSIFHAGSAFSINIFIESGAISHIFEVHFFFGSLLPPKNQVGCILPSPVLELVGGKA